MTIERWVPSQTYTRQETAILKSLRRTCKLFAFLRDHRHELFDDELQSALEAMYRKTGCSTTICDQVKSGELSGLSMGGGAARLPEPAATSASART
jgi:hypothetical protein